MVGVFHCYVSFRGWNTCKVLKDPSIWFSRSFLWSSLFWWTCFTSSCRGRKFHGFHILFSFFFKAATPCELGRRLWPLCQSFISPLLHACEPLMQFMVVSSMISLKVLCNWTCHSDRWSLYVSAKIPRQIQHKGWQFWCAMTSLKFQIISMSNIQPN